MMSRVCPLLVLFVGMALMPVLAEEPVGQNSIFLQCAIDDDGNLHIVYVTRDWGEVFYMKYNGATWIGPTPLAVT